MTESSASDLQQLLADKAYWEQMLWYARIAFFIAMFVLISSIVWKNKND